MSQSESSRRLALHIGRMPDDDTWWLCLADQDGTEMALLAEFVTENHATLFSDFMETQGYISLKLPTQSEIDELFEE